MSREALQDEELSFQSAADGSIRGTVIGQIETGEDSDNGDAVMSALDQL